MRLSRRATSIILILVLLAGLFTIILVTNAPKNSIKSLDSLFADIKSNSQGKWQAAIITYRYFNISERLTYYTLVESWGVDLEQYIGAKYDGTVSALVNEAPITIEECTIYYVVGQNNLKYIIAEDTHGALSLWFFEHFADLNSEQEQYLKTIFPSSDTTPASEIEKKLFAQ